ncbi:hypothetical protein T492DRAFT_305989 [Pavlovales sp. CCMP2436]|nr:hypothetical protein T492DRAFT_305989 [Pavlovales sp. CCMP2436]
MRGEVASGGSRALCTHRSTHTETKDAALTQDAIAARVRILKTRDLSARDPLLCDGRGQIASGGGAAHARFARTHRSAQTETKDAARAPRWTVHRGSSVAACWPLGRTRAHERSAMASVTPCQSASGGRPS